MAGGFRTDAGKALMGFLGSDRRLGFGRGDLAVDWRSLGAEVAGSCAALDAGFRWPLRRVRRDAHEAFEELGSDAERDVFARGLLWRHVQ
jgi:hypothetical protein